MMLTDEHVGFPQHLFGQHQTDIHVDGVVACTGEYVHLAISVAHAVFQETMYLL